MFWANTNAAEIINGYLNGVEISQKYSKLYEHFEKLNSMAIVLPQEQKIGIADKIRFILSQKCNLACSYCYAQEARSNDILDKQKIKTIVDYFLSIPNNNTKSFSFIGGGEPILTWDLFVWAVNYIKNATKGQKINIGLSTNATLLNEERIVWLKQNNVGVGVSFDILPEIQNKQRCFPNFKSSFDVVDTNIKLLIKNGFPPRIRSTITRQNVTLMSQMVLFVMKHYPEIKQLHFEQVADTEQNQTEFYNNFIEYFFKAKEIGNNNGIEVNNSIINSINYIKSRFCSGEFCVTPTGDLVSCHRISSKNESFFNEFCYGGVRDKVQINENKLLKVENVANYKLPQCSFCFAKWHCAGGCTYNRLHLSSEQLTNYCDFVKKMITKELEKKLEK